LNSNRDITLPTVGIDLSEPQLIQESTSK